MGSSISMHKYIWPHLDFAGKKVIFKDIPFQGHCSSVPELKAHFDNLAKDSKTSLLRLWSCSHPISFSVTEESLSNVVQTKHTAKEWSAIWKKNITMEISRMFTGIKLEFSVISEIWLRHSGQQQQLSWALTVCFWRQFGTHISLLPAWELSQWPRWSGLWYAVVTWCLS